MRAGRLESEINGAANALICVELGKDAICVLADVLDDLRNEEADFEAGKSGEIL